MEWNTDEIDDLSFSYVEQCHNQIFKLNQQILSKEPDDNADKYSTYHRLFKYNVFDYIEPKKRQYLEKILVRILSSLGNHISKNLSKISSENETTTARTPTPVSVSSKSSCSSKSTSANSTKSNPRSRLSSYSGPTTRSMLDNPKILEQRTVPELIIISSDDDDDEFAPKRIKTCDTNESNPEVLIKQERSFDTEYIASQSVNLQDITNRLNSQRTSTSNEQQSPENEDSDSLNSESFTKWPPNSLLIVNRRDLRNYSYDKSGVIMLKSKNELKFTVAGRDRQAILLHLIAKLLKLVEEGTYMSKRELYYKSIDFCRANRKISTQSSTQSSSGTQSQPNSTQSSRSNSQKKMNSEKLFQALNDLCCLIGCSKVHLHILSQSKGLVYGNLKFTLEDGQCYDCLENKEGTQLPTSRIPIVDISSNAKFVMIVEKDTIMRKLLNNEQISRFVETYKVILFTAKGYPDVSSRAFVKYLWTRLKIPILALTDADPHGIEIVCSFKFGSYSTAYESTYTSVPQIKWLGFLPSEITKLSIEESKTILQTPIDMKKLESLIIRPYLRDKKSWMTEILILKKLGRKAELEALDKDGTYLIETYLPNKLRFGSWI